MAILDTIIGGISTAVVTVVGIWAGIGKDLVAGQINKQLEAHKAELNKNLETYKSELRNLETKWKLEYEAQASVAAIAKKYSRVILISASDLQDRLWHLCERQSRSKNKVLLAANEDAQMYGSWPMTKRHYLISTLYLFARYFCWLEILKSEVRFLELSSNQDTRAINYHFKRVERMLAETSLQQFSQTSVSTDKPLFQLMQCEIGENLRIERNVGAQCMNFHDFRLNYLTLSSSNEGLAQLEGLLISSMSNASSNFCQTRLRLVGNALMDLVLFLQHSNNLPSAENLEALELPGFDTPKYLALWPSEV
jgi:hypothetical protein